MNLDEELAIEVNPWRGRLITLGVIIGVAVVAGILVYAFFLRGEEESLRPTEDLAVGRATINSNLVISGVAQSQLESNLTFRSTGRVGSINVAVGDRVQEGDVLASLEADELQNSVATAEASLAGARARLAGLLEGATDAELANASQSVVQAENALNNATRDLEDLLDGPTEAQITADIQAVVSAEAALNDAIRARQELVDGPTDAQIMNANQAVISAQAQLDQAIRDRQDLLDGATDSQIAQAQQSVASAQASLASAQATLDQLTSGPDDAAIAAAEAQVASAEQGVASAEIALDNAEASVDTAEAALLAAGSAFCALDPGNDVCPVSVPLSSSDLDDLLDKLGDDDTDAELITPANSVVQANASYMTAVNGVDTAEEALASAEASLDAAEANLDALHEGASDEDIAAAEAAVTAAEEGLALAQLNLDELLEGPDANDVARADDAVSTAQASLDSAISAQEELLQGADDADFARADDAIRSAEASLEAAQARLDDLLDDPESDDVDRAEDAERVAEAAVDAAREVLAETERGPRETQIEQERQNVRSAELAVEAARIRLEQSQIISPFSGTVAAVNLTLGEFASSSPTDPPIVLLTPNLIVLEMSIGETDYPQVELDQGGIALFDAIPGRPFPFRVIEIGLAPTVNQGVVTYPIKGAIVVPPDGPRPSPGMSANGQIITDSLPDVLVVPARAIRRSGGDQVVDVRRNGEVVEQVVTTGASDTNNVQILEGLSEGDTIVVPALVGGSADEDEPDPTLPQGIR